MSNFLKEHHFSSAVYGARNKVKNICIWSGLTLASAILRYRSRLHGTEINHEF